MNKTAAAKVSKKTVSVDDNPLMVRSVEKALKVLDVFVRCGHSLSLTALAAELGVDKSTAQRFSHTLERLGYLKRNPATKHFDLGIKVLDLGYGFLHANTLLNRAMPYLIHLSRETEETINITMRDGAEIVFVSRFMSRHLFNTDVTIGTRMPVYCTAPGIAMLSKLPRAEAISLLEQCDRRKITENTTWEMEALEAKLDVSGSRGYATAFEEFYHDDLSISAPIFDAGLPLAAVTVSVSRVRFTPQEAEARFSSLVVAAARSISNSTPQIPISRG
ncbi:MAG: IclR family transcriptional regulator [Bosea sp.]|uniref:IclR family transcriptional regulator n=1 Tax=Bosea sp. (in: a-proteobacteria) TaxID=1871050 RepID=UPI001AC55A56|nr:IclR family transcriptional regulator [Bosea sp. (in: a-proteobacteria)]MBN9453326.1 IclR family transcriptional regulator [Bosea sp. (in: a-proteobacteria)]